MRLRSPQDFIGGLALIALAALALSQIGDLRFGTASRMGPGYFPTVLAWLTALFGLILAARAFVLDGPSLEPVDLRHGLPLLLAILVFGLAIRPLGLVLASALLFLVSAFASPELKWREQAIASVALIGLAVLLFVVLLDLPFPVWPRL